MNTRYVLVTAISLLYAETQLDTGGSGSSDLVNKALGYINPPEVSAEGDRSREIVLALRDTAQWLCGLQSGQRVERSALLQRIRVDTAGDDSLYLPFADLFSEQYEQARLLEICKQFRQTLYGFLNKVEVDNIIKEAHRECVFGAVRTPQDVVNFCRDVVSKLDPHTLGGEDKEHPAFVGEVDLSDLNSVEDTMNQAKAELTSDGIIRFGNQATNRLFGVAGGAKRGEFIVVGALQSNYKSGYCLTLLRQAAMYNKPFMRDPTKKPLILRITLENELRNDIMQLYKDIKENETGTYCDIRTVDVKEASQYVSSKMTSNGYHFIMKRYDPSEFSFHDLFDVITGLEAEGYEIHLLNIDYLNMMTKRGCVQGVAGHDTRDLFRRARNFTSKRGITTITPHQLSSEAKQLVRNGVEDFVKEIANKGYWDSCRVIDQEVDVEIYVHIVRIGSEAYLTVQRGKHRGTSEVTDIRDQYYVLRMHKVGSIIDDVNGPDMSLRHVGGSTVAEGGTKAWFATA